MKKISKTRYFHVYAGESEAWTAPKKYWSLGAAMRAAKKAAANSGEGWIFVCRDSRKGVQTLSQTNTPPLCTRSETITSKDEEIE